MNFGIDETRVFKSVRIAILIISDTRTPATDTSGAVFEERIKTAGHHIAGVAKSTLIFCLPGSNGAVKHGWDKIQTLQLDSRYRPCNLVELLPSLTKFQQYNKGSAT